MDLYEKLLSGEEKLSLVGLGYVGMPDTVLCSRSGRIPATATESSVPRITAL